MNEMHGTTICCVKLNGQVAIAADGQVTLGRSVVIKNNVQKIHKLSNGKIITGFAGSVADSLTLLDKFEELLEKTGNNLLRSCISFAKHCRSDKIMRHLESQMIVADKDNIFTLSGNGDVIEPEHNIAAIGSGGQFAYAAGLALLQNNIGNLNAIDVAYKSVQIAGQICVYTNTNIITEHVD